MKKITRGSKAIKISAEVKERLQSVGSELKSRGATEFDPSNILDALVNSEFGAQVIDKFVNDHTPEEFKLRKILEMPEEREKLLGLIGDREFGFSSLSN